MSQVTIYLDKDTEAIMKRAAKSAGLSQSRWIAEVIREKVRGEWPSEVARLAGAWTDFPELEELRRMTTGDVGRESL